MVRKRVAVAGVLPAVARDLEGAAETAGREYDRFRLEEHEAPALAFVAKRTGNALAVFQQRRDGALHVKLNALMNAVVLERADHLEARAIADVREPRVTVAAKVALEDAAIVRAVEQRAPLLEFLDAVRNGDVRVLDERLIQEGVFFYELLYLALDDFRADVFRFFQNLVAFGRNPALALELFAARAAT